MVRTGTSKAADAANALGRLRKALTFHTAARLLHDNLSVMLDPDPIISNAALSAIAYADALTAALGGQINQKDHCAVPKLLRALMGNDLPKAQERNLNKLLGVKNDVQYGSRPGKSADATSLLNSLDAFGDWAKAVLAAKGVVMERPG